MAGALEQHVAEEEEAAACEAVATAAGDARAATTGIRAASAQALAAANGHAGSRVGAAGVVGGAGAASEGASAGERPSTGKAREAAQPTQPARPAQPARPTQPAQPARTRSALSIMRRLVGLTRPLLPVMALAIVLGIVGFLAAIFLTVFATYGLLFHAGMPAALGEAALGVAIAVCGIARGPLRYGEQLCNHYLAFRILALVRDHVFGALRKLAPAKLEGKDKGNLVSMATSDIELLEVFYAHTLSPAAIALVASAIMVGFICAQSLTLGLIALASYAVVGIALPVIASKASGSGGRDVREGIADMNTFVLDSLRGLRETLQYGRAEDRAHELADSMDSLARHESHLKTKTAFFMALTGAVVMAADIAMLAASTHLVAQGAIGFAQAALATSALMSSFGPVIAVANLGSTLQQTLASGARVLDILDEQPQTNEVNDGCDLQQFTGMGAHRVDFAYNDAPVLEGVNLEIAPGEVVQISGRSGAGKSTLLKLLMRFWDPSRGVVEISGADLRHVNTASLREVESLMTQETHLFCGTVRENLALAEPDAADEELYAALEKAALSELIERLPQGLGTPVGELGSTLSGGERQRIGLARVFLHDAPIVLLDEPTSNLDALSEAAVLGALAENREGKTIVLVSHRASTARFADRAYSVDRGCVS